MPLPPRLLLAAACALGAPAALAAPASSVALLASQCVNCHTNQPANASIPALQGHSAAQLLARLQQLQSAPGHEAQASVMPRLLQGLSSAELQALAQWFAAPNTATAPGAQP